MGLIRGPNATLTKTGKALKRGTTAGLGSGSPSLERDQLLICVSAETEQAPSMGKEWGAGTLTLRASRPKSDWNLCLNFPKAC